MTQVSHSRAEGFLLCERKDYYGYRLKLKRKKESDSLALGSAAHEALDTFYQTILSEGGDTVKGQRAAFDSAAKAARNRVAELYAQGYSDGAPNRWKLHEVIEDYLEHEPFVLHGYRILASEFEAHLDMGEGITTLFRVDLLVQDVAGRKAVVDHKVVWDFYRLSDARLQPQMVKYLGMLNFLGHGLDYGMYNMLRSRKVKDPTPEQRQGLLDLTFSDARIRRTLEEHLSAAMRIDKRVQLPDEEADKAALRTANKMVCQSCSFRAICEAELNGEDTRLPLMDYEVKEGRDLPEVDG